MTDEKTPGWFASLKIPEMVIAGSVLLGGIYAVANVQFEVNSLQATIVEMRSHDVPGRLQKLEDASGPSSQAISAHFQQQQDALTQLQNSQQQALNALQAQQQTAINALQTQQHEEASAINAISVQIAGISQQIAYVISQLSTDGRRSK